MIGIERMNGVRLVRFVFALSCLVVVTSTACSERKPESAASASASAPTMANASAPATAAATPSASTPKPPPDAVSAQHVLIAYKGAKGARNIMRSRAAAKKRAEEVVAKAKGGADFA